MVRFVLLTVAQHSQVEWTFERSAPSSIHWPIGHHVVGSAGWRIWFSSHLHHITTCTPSNPRGLPTIFSREIGTEHETEPKHSRFGRFSCSLSLSLSFSLSLSLFSFRALYHAVETDRPARSVKSNTQRNRRRMLSDCPGRSFGFTPLDLNLQMLVMNENSTTCSFRWQFSATIPPSRAIAITTAIMRACVRNMWTRQRLLGLEPRDQGQAGFAGGRCLCVYGLVVDYFWLGACMRPVGQ